MDVEECPEFFKGTVLTGMCLTFNPEMSQMPRRNVFSAKDFWGMSISMFSSYP